jgi:hypothetical protein
MKIPTSAASLSSCLARSSAGQAQPGALARQLAVQPGLPGQKTMVFHVI